MNIEKENLVDSAAEAMNFLKNKLTEKSKRVEEIIKEVSNENQNLKFDPFIDQQESSHLTEEELNEEIVDEVHKLSTEIVEITEHQEDRVHELKDIALNVASYLIETEKIENKIGDERSIYELSEIVQEGEEFMENLNEAMKSMASHEIAMEGPIHAIKDGLTAANIEIIEENNEETYNKSPELPAVIDTNEKTLKRDMKWFPFEKSEKKIKSENVESYDNSNSSYLRALGL